MIRNKRQMKGTLKSFNEKEHRVYDSKGKEAILTYLKKNFPNLRHISNPDPYGIDVLSLNEQEEVVACWEVEVRHGNWQGNRAFPFREKNCIERKDYQWRREKEFLDKIPYQMSESYSVFYVQMNKECTRAAIIDGNTVLEYPLKPWRNRKAQGEFVRQVPINRVKQCNLKGDK